MNVRGLLGQVRSIDGEDDKIQALVLAATCPKERRVKLRDPLE